MSKQTPFAVDVPEAGKDSPGWIKVGVIAAVGFVLGIAWPRVMGVRLGIAAPGESTSAAATSGSAHGGRAPESPAASVVTKTAAAEASAAPAAAPAAPAPAAPAVAAPSAPAAHALNISVQKGSVLSCKTTDGDTKKGKECGSIAAIDQFISPRVRKLASCPDLAGATGKLSLLVGADFASNKFTFDVGKSSTISNPDGVATCLKSTFKGNAIASTTHEHARYTIAYPVTFAAAGDSSDEETSAVKGKADRSADKADKAKDESKADQPLSGEAKVMWETAPVRETPKTGELVTRLPRGTKVKVGTSKDGWYQIKYGDGFANEGWVHRGALGR